MIESLVIAAIFSGVTCLVNIIVCIWEHDTRQLLPWFVALCGWFVAFCQLMIRMNKGDSHE